MRTWWLVFVVACSSAPKSTPKLGDAAAAPTKVGEPAPAAPVSTTTAPAPAPSPARDWSPPKRVDLVAALPKTVPGVPDLEGTTDPAKQKAAKALNAQGIALHGKDPAGAEAKYLAALAEDSGHLLARYNLACVYNRTGRTQQGLALLVQLSAADCGECIARAAWDDDWQSQFGEEVFWQVLELGPEVESPIVAPGLDEPTFTCPRGTTKQGSWSNHNVYCARGGVKHGPSVMKVPDGHGEYISFSEVGEYKNGKKHGPWSGTTSLYAAWKGAFVDDKPHGVWRYSDQEERRVVGYVRGAEVGTPRVTDPDGVIIAQSTVENGAKIERRWSKGEGDQYFLSEEIVKGPDDKPMRETRYDAPGRLALDGSYVAGEKSGAWRTYADGVLQREITYERGKPHGKEVSYDAGGKPAAIAHWDQGKAHGVFEYWHAGKLLARTTMTQDSGDWVEYSGDRLVEKGRMENGVRVGPWQIEDAGNRRWSVGAFTAGKRTGPWTHYDNDDRAKKRAEGEYVADKRHGAWTIWNAESDPPVTAKGTYVAGEMDGTWKLYTEDSDEPAQTVVIRKNKLVKVDGKRASKNYQKMFAWVTFVVTPAILVEGDADDLPE